MRSHLVLGAVGVLFLIGSALAVTGGRGISQQGTVLQSGTGAVLQTLETAERRVMSVKDFGAACDGSTDDTTALINGSAAAVTFSRTLLIDCKLFIKSAAGTIAAPLNFEGNGGIDTTNASASVTLTGTVTAPISQIFYTGSGTLTVSGTSSTILSPHWWGAKGDDTNDDGPAIQKAAAAITGRGTVSFEGNKTYRLPTTVNVPMGVSFDGNGATLDVSGTNGVVFDYNVGAGVLTFSAPPTVFANFRVNGDAAKTATTLVQTFRMPYFTMRDVIAFFTNIAKIQGGGVLTEFDHVIAYTPIGTVYWFTTGSDSFGANFTELNHCWIENAQNSSVIGVRIDKGEIQIHNSYFEQLPIMVWVNGGQVGLYDNSFNFRGWPSQGLLINSLDVPYGANPVGSGEIIVQGNEWGFGEVTSAVNTQVMIETSVSLSIMFEGNKVNDFNSIASTPTTLFKTDSPNGNFFGVIADNKFYSQEETSFQNLMSVFDPTTVAGGFSNLAVNNNWFYGSSGPFPGQIDITKAGAAGTITDSVFSGNQFLRTTNFLQLSNGRISNNVFQTAPTITWPTTGGSLTHNTFNNGAPTVTGATIANNNPGYGTTTGASSHGIAALAYSGTIATDASTGDIFRITATNGTAFTISSPVNPTTGQSLTYIIRNTSGGAHGAITWGAAFKTAAAALTVATGNSKSIEFNYDGSNWIESFRSAADVAN